jgi:hypothetical protein
MRGRVRPTQLEPPLLDFETRCHPEDATLVGFDKGVRAWGRGSDYVNLKPEKYGEAGVALLVDTLT